MLGPRRARDAVEDRAPCAKAPSARCVARIKANVRSEGAMARRVAQLHTALLFTPAALPLDVELRTSFREQHKDTRV